MTPRMTADGFGGVVGIPRQTFPNIAGQDYDVNLTLSAPGFVSRKEVVTVKKLLTPFSDFVPGNLEVELHREPTIISGRTIRFVNESTPVGGATINFTEMWRVPVDLSGPFALPDLVALQPPLYSERAATETLRSRNLSPIIGSEKTLVAALLPGASQILLSDRVGLVAGDILLIDQLQPDLSEFIPIKTVPVTSPADQPTLIELEHKLAHGHRNESVVVQVNPGLSGLPQQLTLPGSIGDTCVFLNGLAGLAGASEIEISGPGGPVEYHKVMTFNVVSDANGYFRLPPLNRVAQFRVHAERTIGAQLFEANVLFRPDYGQRENRLDLLLK